MQIEFFKRYITTENTLLFLVVSTGVLLGFAFVLEYFVDLVPCPLCIVQRFFYLLIGLTALAALFWSQVFTRLRSGSLVLLWAIIGGGVALRQVILQHQPQDIDSTGCAVSFGSFFGSFLYALGGRGNCGVVDWTFLTFSIAEWSLVWFGIFFFVGVYLLIKRDK